MTSSAAHLKLASTELSPSFDRLRFTCRFSTPGIHPFDECKWTTRTASISGENGKVVFEQRGVEVPEAWSQMATNVVVSKYFRGALGSAARETSVRQLIGRVADTISGWGAADGYFESSEQADVFRNELTALLLKQLGAFNSPVWFNVGVEAKPQCSACFILSVEDSMESLLALQRSEGMLFKYGSGAGSNLSRIRSQKEQLSGGGSASGPVTFMRGYDSWAGTIKSGGKTRRAAKMQILDVDHPDIADFVNAKRLEEEKAWALIEQGYDGGFNVPGGAYDSVFFQNSNLSVRVTDEFMQRAVGGNSFTTRRRTDGAPVEEIDARALLQDIALGTWICGDPGLQFDTIINDWHTCPNSGRINASNPCSEYMHLDDSACNLASINLLSFLNEDGSFDTDGLCHAVDILITAQDILVDNASYPTEKIGANARKFRQLGLGFANLGALLMSMGVGYDSDEGRELAAALMSIISGRAYRTSGILAAKLGAFDGFAENDNEMLRVIEKHRAAAVPLGTKTSANLRLLANVTECAKTVWHEALAAGRLHGYRNSQTTVLAPTGTIAFLMDCDTTGIEPDIALVKYKKLVGGGMLKIVNQSVPRALTRLGYGDQQIREILQFIDTHDTIEGAPHVTAQHLAIFDCAFKPSNGGRSIAYPGHLKMMAACQPFVSGAISKTVNMPESATTEDIFNAYVEAWRLGIKAVAIYRDNSKRSQPLATKLDVSPAAAQPALDPNMLRRKLPDERSAITHKFNIGGHEGYITVGLYEDGTPGEIFLVMAKEGSTLSGVMDSFATSISLALQYGVPLEILAQKFSHTRFEPSGFTSNPDIPFAKSFMDYIFQWLAGKFLTPEQRTSIGVRGPEVKLTDSPAAPAAQGGAAVHGAAFQLSDDAPPCTTCGSSLMVRQGACYRCLNCGSQGGCG